MPGRQGTRDKGQGPRDKGHETRDKGQGTRGKVFIVNKVSPCRVRVGFVQKAQGTRKKGQDEEDERQKTRRGKCQEDTRLVTRRTGDREDKGHGGIFVVNKVYPCHVRVNFWSRYDQMDRMTILKFAFGKHLVRE